MRYGSKSLCASAALILAVALSGWAGGKAESAAPGQVNYPVKPIKFIVPWAAGGSTDIVARAVATAAEKKMNQPVVVENRAGGNATIGTQTAALAAGDGYTILVAAVTPTILQPYYVDVKYSPEDFKGIAQIGEKDMVIVTRKTSPWTSFSALITDAKAEPNKYLFCVAKGNSGHLLFEEGMQKKGFRLKHYPVQGDAQAVTAVLSGTSDIALLASISVGKAQIDSGELRALAVFSEKRSPVLPDVPTLKELGLDLAGAPWTGLLVPKSVPDDLLKVIQARFKEVLETPEFLELMKRAGEKVIYLDGDTFMKKVLAEYRQSGEIINALGMGKKRK